MRGCVRVAEERAIAQTILDVVGRANVRAAEHCMTRLRLDLADVESVDPNRLKKISGVKGVVRTGNQLQIIFGPGLAERVTAAVAAELRSGGGSAPQAKVEPSEAGAETRPGGVRSFLKRIANIFLPLLPAIIGSGLIIGLTNFFVRIGWITDQTTVAGVPVLAVLQVLGGTFLAFMHILVGMNAAREYGGPAAIGALAGMLLIAPSLQNIPNMAPGRGGIIGALIAGAFLGWLYKTVNRRMPDTISVMASPFITVLVGGAVILFVVQPIGFYASNWIANGVKALLDVGGPLVGAVLAGTFLPMVMLGIHQGTVPIHVELINSLGNTPLLPILAMAGAGQVGASLAVYVKTRNRELRQIILSALPVGILGIGEPLIYGVTLPLGRPFVAACLGGAVGGAFIAVTKIGALALGVSGVLLAFLVTNPALYLLGILISYAAGFAISYAMGFDESLAQNSQTFAFTAD
ncbi:MAG: PTS sugar transporter subunit IIC [Bacillota bacterium]|nr:MAG: PTS sugar transporter subunit IIC [Bacillota bacterium]